MVYHAYTVAMIAAAIGALVFATGALRYSPLYHAMRIDTRFGERAARS